ncbi:1-acyl-sn-glycerol-3-phosphate acyltransferase [Opitutus sp. ER46]|uniref:1-acyl-sn-glycerol-3-phosphate acyltransferase n=1 Tax=Opitutus sp. ER46 TaxID=2161864 RepID=UPI000D31E3ED|nr:1-acyl-sn-glycerol-3-phosphate acyltransferase [Opitutus sp. ER46]PTX91671.1 hypothetical protein DB354_17540 [Opitutus sp. ER46]
MTSPAPTLARLQNVLAASRAGRVVATGDPAAFARLDSISKLELLLEVESTFGVELPEGRVAGLRGVTELAALIDEQRAASPAVPADPLQSWLREPLPVVRRPDWRAWPMALLVTAVRWRYRVRVQGREHLNLRAPCLVCANHSSHLDGLALLAAARPDGNRMVFAVAKDYFYRRAGWCVGAVSVVWWARGGDVAAARENLRQVAACRATGRPVVFFPEGTRSPTGELQPFREGLEFLASRLDLPVVPCWIEGAYAALPKGATWPRGGRISVSFGPALRARAGEEGFAARVRAAMLSLRSGPRA